MRGAQINGERLAQLFEMMAAEANSVGGISNSYTIDYQHADQPVDTDTWIPQIILVLRPTE